MSNTELMPAFPTNEEQYGGMFLRDYFAAKAMQSILIDPQYADVPERVIALNAYRVADAMMQERKK